MKNPRLRVIGVLIGKVDRIIHGMELGMMGMHNQVRQWPRQGFMCSLLELLHNNGLQVFLASDHGNIEATGCGRPSERAVADMHGERVRIYSDPKLRAQIKKEFPESIEWPTIGLPENYLALIASNRNGFVREKETIICHGALLLRK